MRYCEKCKVTVRTRQERCPLCQGELSGAFDSMERMFPELQQKGNPYALFLKCMGFFCIVAVVVCMTINWLVTPGYWWSVFVAAGAAMSFASVSIGIRKRRNLLKNALWQMLFLEAALVIWDVAAGWQGWSLTYFLPLGILSVLLFMNVITVVQKLDSPEYMIYLLMAGILGLLPLVFLLLDMVTVELPSIICIGASVLLLSGLFIFQFRAVREEVRKKFHI